MLLTDLVGKHTGKTICVMGGAPSLIEDLKKVDADIYISANQHGCLVRKCDYIVAIDARHLVHKVHMGEFLRPYNTPIISPRFFADYRVADFYVQGFMGNSGLFAISVAVLMGALKVVVAGIEMYTGDTYFHDKDTDSPGFHLGDVKHQHRIDVMLNFTRDQNVRKLSGPLPLKLYDPDEVFKQKGFPNWVHRQARLKTDKYICVRKKKWHSEYFIPGDVIDLTPNEAACLPKYFEKVNWYEFE